MTEFRYFNPIEFFMTLHQKREPRFKLPAPLKRPKICLQTAQIPSKTFTLVFFCALWNPAGDVFNLSTLIFFFRSFDLTDEITLSSTCRPTKNQLPRDLMTFTDLLRFCGDIYLSQKLVFVWFWSDRQVSGVSPSIQCGAGIWSGLREESAPSKGQLQLKVRRSTSRYAKTLSLGALCWGLQMRRSLPR